MKNTIRSINLNDEEADFVKFQLEKKLNSLDLSYQASIEQFQNGMFKGTILASNKSAPAFVSIERRNLIELCHGLSISLKSQILTDTPDKLIQKDSSPFSMPDYNFGEITGDESPAYLDGLLKDLSSVQKVRALIVDDDIDALIPVEKLLQKHGCETKSVLNHFDALEQIKNGFADIIILDWNLGKTTGGDIIEKCTKIISQTGSLYEKFMLKPPKIVTYSGTNHMDINFSKGAKNYFKHVDHWSKPIRYVEMEKRARDILIK